jgi:hypothetical protein
MNATYAKQIARRLWLDAKRASSTAFQCCP